MNQPMSPFSGRSFLKLELPCPKSSPVVASADPDPRWTLDDLFTELQSLEQLLPVAVPSASGSAPASSPSPLNLSDSSTSDPPPTKPFVMSVSDDDVEDEESGTRFCCTDLDFSSSDSEGSGDESLTRVRPTSSDLVPKKSLEEGTLYELQFDHRLKMKEQLRGKLSALESYQQNENESAMFRLERFTQSRQEMDRRLDKQYQRKVAEVLDKHLSVIQRDHQQRSQIEERRIRDDAVLEEAKRKERELQEEKVRQEKAKAEEEARLKAIKIAEEEKTAKEAKERASKEAADKEAVRIREAANAAAEVASKEALEQKKAAEREILSMKTGIRVMATEAALKAEANRLKLYDEVAEKYHPLAQDLSRYARKINILLRQISGGLENVRAKATALMNLFKNPECPQPISILIFAKKVVCLCDNPTGSFDSIAFACGHVILLLTSQVPAVMEFVLAELHKACIYTVPKHLHPSSPTSNTKDYYKVVGYREEGGKLESSESYLNRVSFCIRLYAAIIQTENESIRNPHGLKEGWSWLARFMNALPANRPTAVALEGFLEMAGFALYRRYGRQFVKIVNVIRGRFLPAMKERDPGASEIITRLQKFLDLRAYEKEPEGRQLRNSLWSDELKA